MVGINLSHFIILPGIAIAGVDIHCDMMNRLRFDDLRSGKSLVHKLSKEAFRI